MKSEFKAALALFIATIFGASIAVVTKIALHNTGPFSVLFLRFFFASLILLPVAIKKKPYKNKHFSKLLLVSILASLNTSMFVWGIQYTSASVSQILYGGIPLLILLFNIFILKIKIPLHKAVGVLIGLAGISYIVYLSFLEKGTTITGTPKGNIAVLLAMLSWMFYTIYSKKVSLCFSPLVITSVSVLVSLLFAGVLFAYELFSVSFIVTFLNPSSLLTGLHLGVVGSVLYYILYQYGIKHSSPLTASLTTYIQPVIATLMAVIFLGESLTGGFIMGSTFVLAGIFLTSFVHLHKIGKR